MRRANYSHSRLPPSLDQVSVVVRMEQRRSLLSYQVGDRAMRQNYASNDGSGLACVLSNLGPVTRSCVVEATVLHGRYGRWPPLSADSSIASPSCQTSTGVRGYLHSPRGREAHGVHHLSSWRQAPLRTCQPRADKKRRSSSAAKPYWITDDSPPAASTTTHHPNHPLVGINASSGRQNISPPTTCLTTLYILRHGRFRARHLTDRPKRRRLPQKFSVILANDPLHPTAIP